MNFISSHTEFRKEPTRTVQLKQPETSNFNPSVAYYFNWGGDEYCAELEEDDVYPGDCYIERIGIRDYEKSAERNNVEHYLQIDENLEKQLTQYLKSHRWDDIVVTWEAGVE